MECGYPDMKELVIARAVVDARFIIDVKNALR
jgi:hypothetical protein